MRIAGLMIAGLFVSIVAFGQQGGKQPQKMDGNMVVHTQSVSGPTQVTSEKHLMTADKIVPANGGQGQPPVTTAQKREMTPLNPNQVVKSKK
ncbi:MAG: hypothetical protein JWO06_1521 [Bacteroidota bacterium]|nr:hypothetical protein [Bacteroidota bacterium]